VAVALRVTLKKLAAKRWSNLVDVSIHARCHEYGWEAVRVTFHEKITAGVGSA
jgi:hypothetical protein